jgi:hypothetical protein
MHSTPSVIKFSLCLFVVCTDRIVTKVGVSVKTCIASRLYAISRVRIFVYSFKSSNDID